MKKFLPICLTLMLAIAYNSSGQITITQNDFPVIGVAWAELHDDRQNVHTISPGGASQTWNYASAFLISDTTILHFQNVSVTPAAGQAIFTNADMAFLSADGILSTYLKSHNDGLYLDGAYDDTSGLAIDLDPDELIIPAPMTFNDTRNHNSVLSIEQPAMPPNPGILFKSYLVQQFTADAYGSLTTPAGTYPNTLRIKSFQYSIDSTFIDAAGTGNYVFLNATGPADSSISYAWLKNGAGSLLLDIEQDPATLQSDGASYYQSVVIGIDEYKSGGITHFPNPVLNGLLNIRIEDAVYSELRVFDNNGKLLFRDNINGINNVKLSTQHYEAGVYFYELSAEGVLPAREKFIIY